VLQHFQARLHTFDDLLGWAKAKQVQALFVAASYPSRGTSWITPEQAQTLRQAKTLVVQDLGPSPLSATADWVLPGAAFAEKEGTFVNHAGLAQAVHWGVTPSGEVRTEGQVYLDLMQRTGLLHVATLRKELASEVRAFAPLAKGDLGSYGIFLESLKDSPKGS
jgi:NADH-quinone oxidoreductase subunit G